jgi:outer membrane receptor protein involved in Fe transport
VYTYLSLLNSTKINNLVSEQRELNERKQRLFLEGTAMNGMKCINVSFMRAMYGLVMAIGFLTLSCPLTAMGQASSNAASSSDPSVTTPANLGKVEVLGTRIKRSSYASSRPVLTLNRTQIQATGLTNLGQVLQTITSAGSAVNNRIDVGGNGQSQIDLRNLGAKRVLVLLNGKRVAPGLGGTVNLDTIPTSIVKSIQVLKDGASASYGSDAIAGVINIITRKDFRGSEASAYAGGYEYNGNFDGLTQLYNYTYGLTNDNGNITLALTYRKNNNVPDSARKISAVPYFGTSSGSSITPQGRFEFYPPQGSSLYSNATLCPPNSTGRPFCDLTMKKGTPGSSISDFRPFQAPSDFYNYAAEYDLIAPNKNLNIYGQGSYNITDSFSAHITAFYNRHNSVRTYSPYALNFGPGTDESSLISKSNPYNPFGFDLNPDVDALQPGQAQSVLIGRRPVEGGFRHFTSTVDTFYYDLGLSGNFNVSDRELDWDADYVVSKLTDADLTPTGEFNTRRINYALGPASECSAQPGCVPLNVFGGQYSGGTITPSMLNYVQTSEHSQTYNSLHDITANLSGSDILDLPGGPLGVAIGYEYRQVGGSDHPDSLQQAGISTDGFAATTKGQYHVNSLYGELDVPLLSDLPAAKTLGVDLSIRYSRYTSFGSNTSKRAGFRYEPNDQLLIRGTISQGFRAPNISELFTGLSGGFPFVTDPCSIDNIPTESAGTAANCRAAGVPASYEQPVGQIPDTVGGNTKLSPETSLSKSIGFVFNPNAIPGFDINADYFRINVSNLISTYGAQNILNGCYVGNISKYCSLIARNSAGIITNFLNINENVGNIFTDGVDVGANYTFSTRYGAFKISLQSTFTNHFRQTVPNAGNGPPTVYHLAGRERGEQYEGYPKNKSILSVNWDYENWLADVRLRYISGMTEDCTGFVKYGVCSDPKPDHRNFAGALVPTNHLGATTYVDVHGAYNFPSIHTQIAFGVRNLLDRGPPPSYTAHNLSFDPTIYDLPGRLLYGRITVNF